MLNIGRLSTFRAWEGVKESAKICDGRNGAGYMKPLWYSGIRGMQKLAALFAGYRVRPFVGVVGPLPAFRVVDFPHGGRSLRYTLFHMR